MRGEIKNIMYIQLYYLYNDKKTKGMKLINLNSQKTKKKIKCFKFNEKQFYFIYNNQIFYYLYITKNDLYILTLLKYTPLR